MAVGGFGAILAGLGEAVQRSEQNRQRQQMLQMEQAQLQERLKASQQEREAGGLAFPSLLSGGGELSGLANIGGGAPMPQAPAPPPASMPSMTPGRALTDARVGDVPPRGTPEREALKSTIYKYESGDRNIPNYRYDPTHTAGGYGQITNSTWRDVGREDPAVAAYPNAMSAPREVQDRATDDLLDKRGLSPWVPFNPALAKALGKHEVPTPVHQEMEQTAQKVAQAIPPMAQGRVALQALAQQIEKANPGADPTVKMMALERLHKLLAPSEQQQFQMYMLQNRQEFQAALKDMQIQAANDRATQAQTATAARQDSRAETSGWTTMDMAGPDGKKIPVRVQASTGKVEPLALPEGGGGLTKPGTASQSAVSPQARGLIADGIANYQLPPLSGWALKSPEGQATMAEVMKKNPDYQASKFTGKQSGARAMGTRSANLEMATDVAEEQIPLVQQTSDKIDRTEYPTINKMVLAAEKGTGDENIVRFLEQINTLKYVYARALNPTGVARIQDLERFDNIINEAWSKGQVRAALDQMKQSLAAERRGVSRAMGEKPAEGGGAPQSGGVIKLDADGNPVK